MSIAVLVVKPWSTGAPQASLPSSVSTTAMRPEPDAAVAPDRAIAPGQPTTGAATANLPTIEPDRWAQLSASLRRTDEDGVVFVARDADGVFYDVQATTPSDSPIQQPASTDGSTNTVRGTGLLGNPVAIGFTRRTSAEIPVIVGWQFRDWADQFRLALTHPIGDADRYLLIGTWLPRREQNVREISRQPPQWQGGTYQFALTAGGRTRYVFVILDP